MNKESLLSELSLLPKGVLGTWLLFFPFEEDDELLFCWVLEESDVEASETVCSTNFTFTSLYSLFEYTVKVTSSPILWLFLILFN